MQQSKEQLEQYWEGYTNGMRKGSMLGWEAGFNAAVVIISKLHPEIDASILQSLKDLLDKTIPDKKEQEWDPNVRNDEII